MVVIILRVTHRLTQLPTQTNSPGTSKAIIHEIVLSSLFHTMYSKHLTYTEQDVYNRYTKIDIECVCPTSSGARDKQKKPVKPKGLTLVGLVEEKIFDDVFIKLNDLHNFTKNERLHLTMLGLFDDSRKCNPLHRDLCVKSIKNFFDQHEEEKFEIKYTTVRPGTYYPPNSRK